MSVLGKPVIFHYFGERRFGIIEDVHRTGKATRYDVRDETGSVHLLTGVDKKDATIWIDSSLTKSLAVKVAKQSNLRKYYPANYGPVALEFYEKSIEESTPQVPQRQADLG